jgi:PIN domain nuclease of toxin-antitoxin system
VEHVKFLLDTHVVFWIRSGTGQIGRDAKRALKNAKLADVAISDVTLYELAVLNRKGRIKLAREFLPQLARETTVLPIDANIAVCASMIALPQGDPFDRIIVATALEHDLVLVTKDAAIQDAKVCKTVW